METTKQKVELLIEYPLDIQRCVLVAFAKSLGEVGAHQGFLDLCLAVRWWRSASKSFAELNGP